MKYLKNTLFVIVIVFFFNEPIQAQLQSVSANYIETATGLSEICHETHEDDDGGLIEAFTYRVGGGIGYKGILYNSGLFTLGTADVCRSPYFDGTYLAVEGRAYKSSGPLWDIELNDQQLRTNTTMGNSTKNFLDINFYNYKHKRADGLKYGVSAQEMKKHFPNSVSSYQKNGVECHTFNPNNLFITSLKVTQENSKEIIEQDERIRNLAAENQDLRDKLEAQQKEIETIKAALNLGVDIPRLPATEVEFEPVHSTIHISTEHDTPQLQQNIPNPFQRSTTIPYYLPEGTKNATLLIHDITGKTIAKHILLAKKGEGKIQVHIDSAQLRGGTYTYILYVNDQLIDTKKMILLTK